MDNGLQGLDSTEFLFMFAKDNLNRELLIKLHTILENCNFNDKRVRKVEITKIIASDIDIIKTCIELNIDVEICISKINDLCITVFSDLFENSNLNENEKIYSELEKHIKENINYIFNNLEHIKL